MYFQSKQCDLSMLTLFSNLNENKLSPKNNRKICTFKVKITIFCMFLNKKNR